MPLLANRSTTSQENSWLSSISAARRPDPLAREDAHEVASSRCSSVESPRAPPSLFSPRLWPAAWAGRSRRRAPVERIDFEHAVPAPSIHRSRPRGTLASPRSVADRRHEDALARCGTTSRHCVLPGSPDSHIHFPTPRRAARNMIRLEDTDLAEDAASRMRAGRTWHLHQTSWFRRQGPAAVSPGCNPKECAQHRHGQEHAQPQMISKTSIRSGSTSPDRQTRSNLASTTFPAASPWLDPESSQTRLIREKVPHGGFKDHLSSPTPVPGRSALGRVVRGWRRPRRTAGFPAVPRLSQAPARQRSPSVSRRSVPADVDRLGGSGIAAASATRSGRLPAEVFIEQTLRSHTP